MTFHLDPDLDSVREVDLIDRQWGIHAQCTRQLLIEDKSICLSIDGRAKRDKSNGSED